MKTRIKINRIISLIIILMICAGSQLNLNGQSSDKLSVSTPESEGVSTAGIIDFLNAIDTGRVEIHSFMFLRHGKVIAKGWWNPYGAEYKHILYSASKTFTATAVGLAISEKRLNLTDKVSSFFPYSRPDSISDYMKDLTVENLLTMSVGQDPEPRSMGNNGDWINTFLGSAPVHKPGTVFRYNNMATFMLSAIVQQVTNQRIFDYLQPRIFQPLGIQGIDWDLNPQGINLGMIGLRLRTEDLAKFGQLLLQGGIWNKRQLLSGDWVKKATSFKIETPNPPNNQAKEMSDWAQGYCYQMWRGRNNTVRLDGLGGQFVVLIPDKDAVVVLNANARNTQDEMNLIHNYLIPAIKSDQPLPLNPDLYNELVKRQDALSIKIPSLSESDLESSISEKEFILEKNDYDIQSVYFSFGKEGCSLALKRNNNISIIRAGSGRWKISNSTSTSILSPARNPVSRSIDASYQVPQPLFKLGASYSWTDSKTLEFSCRFIEESIITQDIICKFSDFGGNINVTIEPKSDPSLNFLLRGGPAVPLRGSMAIIK